MTIWQLIRWCLVLVSLATVVIAHLVTVTARRRHNGQSQLAVLGLFAAMRLYALMLAVNMSANALTGRANNWAFYLFIFANVYLLYSLIAFYRLVRGRRL